MKVSIHPDRFGAALSADSEFRLQARYWNGALQLQFGDDAHVFRLDEGEIVGVDSDALAGGPCEVIIRAPMEDWYEWVQPIPRPLYHELYPALWHHGFEFEGDPDYVWPYYAALRRAGELVREHATVEED